RTWVNPPDIGGRYSALSFFGLVPAALLGLDVGKLLDEADRVALASHARVPLKENLAVRLGAIAGGCARAKCDKLTLLSSPRHRRHGRGPGDRSVRRAGRGGGEGEDEGAALRRKGAARRAGVARRRAGALLQPGARRDLAQGGGHARGRERIEPGPLDRRAPCPRARGRIRRAARLRDPRRRAARRLLQAAGRSARRHPPGLYVRIRASLPALDRAAPQGWSEYRRAPAGGGGRGSRPPPSRRAVG